MNIFKKIISLSLLLMITIASTIPAYASSYIQKEDISVGKSIFTQSVDYGSDLIYQVYGKNDTTFDKCELGVRVWYDNNQEYDFGGMQTFTNANVCKYNDKGHYRQIHFVCHITRLKVWCRITKGNECEENIINVFFD